ncbi:hypothetical protein H920_03481 [Fukomys damarensis]|uniref:Uncharacterized protein n=1 Tax=Fukomys damarensis TaxID=885580 RepID=A0A091DSI6_FUKDA|nr:hypothetical protein H920_03481 [Fukomys damarensis]
MKLGGILIAFLSHLSDGLGLISHQELSPPLLSQTPRAQAALKDKRLCSPHLPWGKWLIGGHAWGHLDEPLRCMEKLISLQKAQLAGWTGSSASHRAEEDTLEAQSPVPVLPQQAAKVSRCLASPGPIRNDVHRKSNLAALHVRKVGTRKINLASGAAGRVNVHVAVYRKKGRGLALGRQGGT